MNHNAPQRTTDDDDVDAWIARLRAVKSAAPTAANEEDKATYEAIMRYHEQEEAQLLKGAQNESHAWQQMRFRLKKEGLLNTKSAMNSWLPMAMAAALLAAVAIPVWMDQGRNPSEVSQRPVDSLSYEVAVLDTEPATFRGGGQHFKADEPLKLAKVVAKELAKFDPGLKLHWYGGMATIDTDLKEADLDQAEAVLLNRAPEARAIRLQLGFNRLEFSAMP